MSNPVTITRTSCMPYRLRALLSLGLLSSFPAMAAVSLDIHPWSGEDTAFDIGIFAGAQELCRIRKPAGVDGYCSHACRITLPAATKQLSLRGEYSQTDSDTHKRQTQRGTRHFALVDFADVSRRLTQPDQSYGDRFAAFITAVNRFPANGSSAAEAALIEPGKPPTAARIDAAQKRLGYALPAEFLSLQARVGNFQLGDHYLMNMADIDDAWTQMQKNWGSSEQDLLESYNADWQASLKASTLLFTEVGDGLGGLLYRPAPTKTCGDRPLYRWISQEGSPHVLKRDDGSCMDFAEALRWVLDEFLVSNVLAEQASEERDALLIDSTIAHQRIHLHASYGDGFVATLETRWQGPFETGPRIRPECVAREPSPSGAKTPAPQGKPPTQ